MDAPEQVYQLKVRLLGISPMIWRRVLVPVSVTLRELHGVLQVVMGWEGIHLFLFDIYAVRYGSFDLHIANPDVSLLEFGLRGNARFSYIYDMGDHWEHEIRVEAIDPRSRKFHPVCTGGSGACPPEDCGGPDGYLERRDEAAGYDAWRDMGVMADFLGDVVAADAPDRMVCDLRKVLTGRSEQTFKGRGPPTADAPENVAGVFKRDPFRTGHEKRPRIKFGPM